MAKVLGKPGSKVHFWDDAGACPNMDDPKCQKKAYLIPGDQVLVSRMLDSWICGWYQPKRGAETVGWLPSQSLEIPDSVSAAHIDRWVGEWVADPTQSVTIGKSSGAGKLEVKGDASWEGEGNVNVGQIEGVVGPENNRLLLSDGEGEDSCRASLALVESFLVVTDNLRCGGLNVTFRGVYQKK